MELSLLLLHVFISIIYLNNCHAIDLDYLNMDSEEEIQQEDVNYEDNEIESRRVNDLSTNVTTELVTNITATSNPVQYDNEDDDGEEIDLKILSMRGQLAERKRKKAMRHQVSQFPKRTSKTTTSATRKSRSRKPTTPVKLFTEFQYELDAVDDDYDDDDDEDVTFQHLRQRQENITTKKLDYKFNDSESQNDSNKNIYSQFYNLDPAAVFLDFRNPKKVTKSYNTWYVPEHMPCWDLPLLYGELSKTVADDQVFLISPMRLTHVLDKNEERHRNQKAPSHDRKLDKWCGVSPCFGDHSLCLFQSQRNALICDANYRVQVPNMVEQIALVNTLNSMRNHVAKGSEKEYPHLPSAANMQQVIYDYDLEAMAAAWLRQCLPGPAPCNALDASFVAELECTKLSDKCCRKGSSSRSCTPQQECFIEPIIGCLHTWFWSAKDRISVTDVQCGHVEALSYRTVQLIWGKTNKIGCAYGVRESGDIRVVCNFAPGAPFKLRTKFFCGILAHHDITEIAEVSGKNVMNKDFLLMLGISLEPIHIPKYVMNYSRKSHANTPAASNSWGVISLRKVYENNWARKKVGDLDNGTKGLIARLVTRYQFSEETKARCDLEEPMYVVGEPGALCVETGRKFYALCYDFRDPAPGYRVVAVLAPLALFSLILYDLFSGVMRQTNY